MQILQNIKTIKRQGGELRMYLTLTDVANRYKIGKSTVYALIRKGKMPMAHKIGGANRWKLSELENFEEREFMRI